MAIEFRLPELGENINSADILKVLVAVGDKVEVDQVVLEIETDKATIEVPSDVSGVVSKINVSEGSKANVGQVVLTLEETGAKAPAKAEEKKVETAAPKAAEEKKPEPKPAVPEPKKTVSSIYEFKLPDLGENITTAEITKVLISVGEKIKVDQNVLEIETDKATVEVPTEVAGTVKEVRVKDGQKAAVGDVIFIFETETAAAPAPEQAKPETIAAKPAVSSESSKPQTESVTAFAAIEQPMLTRKDLPKIIAPAAPSVRRFAREIGVDIHQVTGSGPGGRISEADVKAFAKSLNEQISKGTVGASVVGIGREPLPDFTKFGEVDRQAMSNIRKKTAEHLSYAWATVPHVTQFDKADITELEKIRKQFSSKVDAAGGKLTVTSMLVKIIASALKVFPQFNSSVDMEKSEVVYKKYYNIGIAVDTDRGLLVPVIRDADKKNITQISVDLAGISKKARDKKLSLEDMQGGCFSISNLGGIGGTYFTPIVNSPEVAILGISKSAYEPVYIDGKFEPRLMMPLSLSYDHRIIDGADAIRFLRWIVNALENPFLLSLEG